MTRLTLTQRRGLSRYREVQPSHTSARAEVIHLAERQAYIKRHPAPPPRSSSWLATALGYAAFWGVVIAYVWVTVQPWFLAWRDGP